MDAPPAAAFGAAVPLLTSSLAPPQPATTMARSVAARAMNLGVWDLTR